MRLSVIDTTCKICGINFKRYRSQRKGCGLRYYYRDKKGRIVSGRFCVACCNLRSSRRRGFKPIDEVTSHNIKKGRKSEKIAAKFFERLGFHVVLTTNKGPDLTVSRGYHCFTCEVKSITSNKKRTSYYMKPVEPARQQDDYIAYVWPNDHIQVFPMTQHLLAVPPSGARCVTKLKPNSL